MIRVFTGKDRVKAQAAISRILGENYEVFDGETLTPADLYNICQGNNLFSSTRQILIKDLTPARKTTPDNSENSGQVGKNRTSVAKSITKNPENTPLSDPYDILNSLPGTKHEIIIWESTISQKKSYKDFIKRSDVDSQKFDPAPVDKWAIFKIYDLAQKDGATAVRQLDQLIQQSDMDNPIDPYSAFGAFASAAIKRYGEHQGTKEKRALKKLSRLDMQMKSTTFEPWTLLRAFLLQLSQ